MNYIQACCHYLMHGIKENRNCNNSCIKINHKIDNDNFYLINKFFDYKYYIYKYNDLTRFNQQEAINHFLTYGMNEKRLFNRNLESIKQIINKIPHDKFLVVCIDYLKNYEVMSNKEVMNKNEVTSNNEVISNKEVKSNNEVTNDDKIFNLIKKEVSIIIQNVIKNHIKNKEQNKEQNKMLKKLLRESENQQQVKPLEKKLNHIY